MTGVELTRLREACNMTQARLALALRVDRKTVNRWENGMVPITHIAEVAIRSVLKPPEEE